MLLDAGKVSTLANWLLGKCDALCPIELPVESTVLAVPAATVVPADTAVSTEFDGSNGPEELKVEHWSTGTSIPSSCILENIKSDAIGSAWLLGDRSRMCLYPGFSELIGIIRCETM